MKDQLAFTRRRDIMFSDWMSAEDLAGQKYPVAK